MWNNYNFTLYSYDNIEIFKKLLPVGLKGRMAFATLVSIHDDRRQVHPAQPQLRNDPPITRYTSWNSSVLLSWMTWKNVMQCPKCAAEFTTVTYENIEVNLRINCKGLWLDVLEKEDLKNTRGSENIDIGDEQTMNKLMRNIIACGKSTSLTVM